MTPSPTYVASHKLGFAFIILKSQGMSISCDEIDCQFVNQLGQIGVAVGRAKTIDGLFVKKNSKKAIVKGTQKRCINFVVL